MSEYSAALQEWTAWKQWVISHALWDEFHDAFICGWRKTRDEILAHNEMLFQWMRSDEGLRERRSLVIQAMDFHKQANADVKKKSQKANQGTIVYLSVIILFWLFASSGLEFLAGMLFFVGLLYVVHRISQGALA